MSTRYRIIHSSSSLVVVDKPCGVSVHNDGSESLIDLVQRDLSLKCLFPVHRLDRETSGVQIFAATQDAAKTFSSAFQTRSVRKIYLGILRGELKAKSGVWNLPLTDRAEGRKSPQGKSKERIPCTTQFYLQNTTGYFSLCEFDLITGRQHQIRKHAALSKHHLVGDARYGDPRYNAKIAEIYGADRMFLHCHRIEIQGHLFQSELPEQFLKLLESKKSS